MFRTALKFVLAFIGVHLLLALALIVTDVIHGVNDMDASFLLWLLVYYGNLPSVFLLEALDLFLGDTSMLFTCVFILFAGIVQWAVVGFTVGMAWHVLKMIVRTARQQTMPTLNE